MKVWIAAKMTGTIGEKTTKFGSQILNRNEAINWMEDPSKRDFGLSIYT
jgi:hypothetical protein